VTDIFKFEQTGVSLDGKIIGDFKPTGIQPLFGSRLDAAGFKLEASTFMPAKGKK
jgi:pilus assembly protein CpaF